MAARNRTFIIHIECFWILLYFSVRPCVYVYCIRMSVFYVLSFFALHIFVKVFILCSWYMISITPRWIQARWHSPQGHRILLTFSSSFFALSSFACLCFWKYSLQVGDVWLTIYVTWLLHAKSQYLVDTLLAFVSKCYVKHFLPWTFDIKVKVLC